MDGGQDPRLILLILILITALILIIILILVICVALLKAISWRVLMCISILVKEPCIAFSKVRE